MLFYLESDGKKANILKLAAITYLIIISVFLQCRTAILGLACVLTFHFFIRANVKRKAIFIVVLAIIILIVISTPTLLEIFRHTFALDKYESATVNELSSGRIGLWQKALGYFAESPLLGTVSYYVDCMYISAYTALGIFGGTALMVPWFKRISKNFKALGFALKHKSSSKLETTVSYMTIFYFVESLLEGQPPFGPGACSAMFWLLCSYMDYTYYKPPKGSFIPIDKSLSQ